MKFATPIALSLLFTAGLAVAQPAEAPAVEAMYQEQPMTQRPAARPQQDFTAVLGALEQALNGLRRLNDLNRLPLEMQDTDQTRSARRAAMMAISTSVAAAVGAAADKDHVKGAMIGAAVGGVIAMIAQEAEASKLRRQAEAARRAQQQPPPPPPGYRDREPLPYRQQMQ